MTTSWCARHVPYRERAKCRRTCHAASQHATNHTTLPNAMAIATSWRCAGAAIGNMARPVNPPANPKNRSAPGAQWRLRRRPLLVVAPVPENTPRAIAKSGADRTAAIAPSIPQAAQIAATIAVTRTDVDVPATAIGSSVMASMRTPVIARLVVVVQARPPASCRGCASRATLSRDV